MATGKTRVVYGLTAAGLITLVVAFIRTAIFSTDAWLIAVLWVGGAIMWLAAVMLSRFWRESKAPTAPPSV